MYHFPETLQADIRVHLNHSLFEQFPEIFDDVSEACLRALASVFRVEVFPRLCYLLKEGDQVTKLYFIVSGSVDVLQGEQSKMNLGEAGLSKEDRTFLCIFVAVCFLLFLVCLFVFAEMRLQ